jgi:hypothetical protein
MDTDSLRFLFFNFLPGRIWAYLWTVLFLFAEGGLPWLGVNDANS